MTFFSQQGNTFRQSATIPEYIKELPLGTYTLKTDIHGFFYEQIEDFPLPKKVYGDLTRNRDRIISTFLDRPTSTGIMLSGEKGSGKTLLSKALSVELRETQKIITIVINTPFCGDAFNTLVQEMKQPALFIFDEFEKVYPEDGQEALLTLLDGVYPTKKLFVITTNDKRRIDRHMRNRPGRIFYIIDFKGLDAKFIREYAEDVLVNKEHIESVCMVAAMFSSFNFDMLKALIEEMNRYDETAQDSVRILNAKPEFEGKSDYTVQLFLGEFEVKGAMLSQSYLSANPVVDAISIPFFTTNMRAPQSYEVEDAMNEEVGYDEDRENAMEALEDDDYVPSLDVEPDLCERQRIQRLYHAGKLTHTAAAFGPHHIRKVNSDGSFVFINDRDQRLVLTKRFRSTANYWNVL